MYATTGVVFIKCSFNIIIVPSSLESSSNSSSDTCILEYELPKVRNWKLKTNVFYVIVKYIISYQ